MKDSKDVTFRAHSQRFRCLWILNELILAWTVSIAELVRTDVCN